MRLVNSFSGYKSVNEKSSPLKWNGKEKRWFNTINNYTVIPMTKIKMNIDDLINEKYSEYFDEADIERNEKDEMYDEKYYDEKYSSIYIIIFSKFWYWININKTR